MRRLFLLIAVFVTATVSATEITIDSVLAEMNTRRTAAGLPPLRNDLRLDKAAGDRVQEMEEQEYWGHVGPTGRSPFVWLKARGYEYYMAGENLAAGFETAEVMVDGWMESKGHRENILSPIYTDCGIAIIEGSTTTRMRGWSVVVLFARPQVNLKTASR
jgi:uncharacterized protein YkwD